MRELHFDEMPEGLIQERSSERRKNKRNINELF
jgi:hypothetical protein